MKTLSKREIRELARQARNTKRNPARRWSAIGRALISIAVISAALLVTLFGIAALRS